MSLDEIISKRQSEAKQEKRVSKKPLKFSPGKAASPLKKKVSEDGEGKRKRRTKKAPKATSGEIQMETGKLKREAAMNAKRGISPKTKGNEKELAKKAEQNVLKKKKKKQNVTVNLSKSPKKVIVPPKTKPVMELAASSEERAVKVKDFTLPKDTKMVITFEPTNKKKTKRSPKTKDTGVASRRLKAAGANKAARASKVDKNRMDVDSKPKQPKRGPRGSV